MFHRRPKAKRRRCPVTGKVSHATEGAAAQQVAVMLAHDVMKLGILHAYRCPSCPAWHVGHRRFV